MACIYLQLKIITNKLSYCRPNKNVKIMVIEGAKTDP